MSKTRVDADGVRGENITRHAGVVSAHFEAAPKPAVLADVAVSRFAGALGATGGVVGQRRLLLCMRQCAMQTCIGTHGRRGLVLVLALALALALVLVLVLVLILVLILFFLANGFLQHVNAAGGGPCRNVDCRFCSLRGHINGCPSHVG